MGDFTAVLGDRLRTITAPNVINWVTTRIIGLGALEYRSFYLIQSVDFKEFFRKSISYISSSLLKEFTYFCSQQYQDLTF